MVPLLQNRMAYERVEMVAACPIFPISFLDQAQVDQSHL